MKLKYVFVVGAIALPMLLAQMPSPRPSGPTAT